MVEKEILYDISLNLTTDRNNFIEAYRSNLFKYVENKKITLRDISEESDVPYSTLNSFLYGSSHDCKLSNTVAIAKALHTTLDELVGAGTLDDERRELMKIYEVLPNNSRQLLQWHFRHQKFIHEKHTGKPFLSVMSPICASNGNLKLTNDYKHLDTSDLEKDTSCKVFFGIEIVCSHYLPHYMEGDVLLIANDRNPLPSENSVIIIDGNILVTKRMFEGNTVKYYGIRDNVFRSNETDRMEVVGYIAHVLREEEAKWLN